MHEKKGMVKIFKAENFFDTSKSMAGDFLKDFNNVWEALPEIKALIIRLGKSLDKNVYEEVKENVWVAKNASIAKSAHIDGPCIIGENTEVRHCAFIRGSVLVGNSCVVGNSTEVKNSIIFDSVQIPHYNYVGDSILGYKSHLGAGAITSNVKSDKTLVSVKSEGEKIDTGLKKFGAIVGDKTEVGCSSVLCPGTVLSKNCTVYPLSRVRGFIRENSIFKSENNIVIKK